MSKKERKQEPLKDRAKQRNDGSIGPLLPGQRREKAYQIREQAALYRKKVPLESQVNNGDENLYTNKIGNFTKALPHNQLGESDLSAYNVLFKALTTGNPKVFDKIPMGGKTKLANPQAAFSYDLACPDSHHLSMSAPPSLASAESAGEMVELYWQALTRDIPFVDYAENNLIKKATDDLSKLTDFKGPKDNGKVTPSTLFRGHTAGDLIGPYISQFLWKEVPYGATNRIDQKIHTTMPDDDHLTQYDTWLKIQNGELPTDQRNFDPTLRYVRNGRDLGELVHKNFPYQFYLNACLILLSYGEEALASSNPYINSNTQNGFITFGNVHILDMTARAARAALEAAWYQKWLVHRRLRPEAFGGLVHNQLISAAKYPIHEDVFNSKAISLVQSKFGTYLLPIAYPEGSPTHPSYPQGHSTIAGACVTMLKAFFNEGYVISDPVLPCKNGLALHSYSGKPLTVGNELNKLASNISIGRDTAGVHYRSDAVEGLKLGEAVAIGILEDYRDTLNEQFEGFSFTKFDGTTITL